MAEPSRSALRAFVAVARELHFGRAARSLYMTTPALSQHIIRLERLVGAELFHRSSRSVELTVAGRQLLPLAQDVLDAQDRINSWARRRCEADTPVRIGFHQVGPAQLLSAIFMRAAEGPARLRLEFRHVQPEEVAEVLRTGEVDVAFAWGPRQIDGVQGHVLCAEERVLLASADSELAARQDDLTLDVLADVPFIVPASSDPDVVRWALVEPRPGAEPARRGPVVRDFDEVLAYVASGLGVHPVPRSVAASVNHVGVVALPVRDIPASSYLLFLPARVTSGVGAAFAEIVLRVRAEHAAT